MAGVVFAFFGYPGAGKSTLCRRFGEMHGIPALDTDVFMTSEEVEAVEGGRYTQSMRLANIQRYCERVRGLLRDHEAVVLADGLPNAGARSHLVDLLLPARVVFVLVQAPPDVWRRRLEVRADNTVRVDAAEAEAYVREHWEPLDPAFRHETVENGDDAGEVDEALRALWQRYVRPP
jgi:predicted kinase